MRILKPHKVAWVLSHGYSSTQGGYRCLICGSVFKYLSFVQRCVQTHTGAKA